MVAISEHSDLIGRYVIVRASLNVPVTDGVVRNTYRIHRALPTLRLLQEQGARVVVLAHIGRGTGDSLLPVWRELTKHIDILWGGEMGSDACTQAHASLQDGQLMLLESVRHDPRERENDIQFAEELASLGEIYINDAFAASHREHTSLSALAKRLPAYAGLNVCEEVAELRKTMKPTAPSVLILGGAKFETKLPLVTAYLDTYDHIFVGGALLNDVLKAQGLPVGRSLVSDMSIAGEAFLKSEKIIPAADVVVRDLAGNTREVSVDGVKSTDTIVDAGSATLQRLRETVLEAQTVLWNGPLGIYEHGREGGTHELAQTVADSSAFSVVGGGDTVAAIADLDLFDQFGFVSTGGGAMLAYLTDGTLPTLELLTGNNE